MKRLLLALAALAAAASLSAETYTIDPVHSSLGFSLRHLVSKFSASFTKVNGTVNYDAAAPEKSSVEAIIAINSVNTADEKRNGHLLSADFFDVAKFPTASFKSKAWKKTGENTFDVTGDLTIKDVTKEVVLQAALLGTGPGMGGATVTGWEVTTKLNKSDYGVNGPAMLGKVLGDEVAITISIEAGHKPAK
jgi:polyisoprenoid-binding protein YceI